MKLRTRLILVMGLIVVIATVPFGYVVYQTQNKAHIDGINAELLATANFAREILPVDYHDKIQGADSVSDAEYLRTVDRWNKLCDKLGLEYIWSLMEVEGEIVFTSGTSTSKDVTKGDHAAFFEKHTNPLAYGKVFGTMEPDYQTIIDKWGRIRAVLAPFRDTHGRKYLFGASMKTTEVDALTRETLWKSLGISVLILGLGMVFAVLLAGSLARPIESLTTAARRIADGDYDYGIENSHVAEIESLANSIDVMGLSIQKTIGDLKNSEQRLRALIANIPGASYRCALDEHGTMEFISSEIETISGYPASDFISNRVRSFTSIIHPDDLKKALNTVYATVERETPFAIEYRIIRAEGEIRWVLEKGQGVFDEGGKLQCLDGVILDITDRKRAEEELEKTQAIFSASFEACPAGILIADAPDVKIRMANSSALGVRGDSPQSLTDIAVENHAINWQTFNPDNTVIAPEDLPLSRAILKGETSSNVEVIIRRETGEDRWVLANAAPVRDAAGAISAGVVVFVDVTDRKRAEFALSETQAELLAHERREKELVEAELVKARKELVHATRLATLGQLIATVSHELRNPLGSIRTAVFSVAGEVRGQMPLIDRALARAERNIVRCDQIIEELLDFTRAKKSEPIPTRIDRWLSGILDEQDIPDHIEVVRRLKTDIKIDVDQEQLRRCVINLLTNACQAMEETQSERAIMTVETLLEGNQLLIRVSDTGHGVPQDKMEKIFEPLYTTKGFGVGLGLPVVEQIMEQLGGEVVITSEPDKGTTAALKLPLL